jgi:hypothetical protein
MGMADSPEFVRPVYDRMWTLQPGVGYRVARVADDETASTLGRFWSGVRQGLEAGDWSKVDELRGTVIDGIPLETDPEEIAWWARAADLPFEDIYAERRRAILDR